MNALFRSLRALLALSILVFAPGTNAQMHGGMGGMLPTPAESFAIIQANIDMYFNEALTNRNATTQQKTAAHAAIATLAASQAQRPGSLYTKEELNVIYKLRFLMQYDSRFTDISQGGLPQGLYLHFSRYQNLKNWGDRGL